MSKKRMLALVLAAVMSLSSATVALADGESTAPVTETTTTSEPAETDTVLLNEQIDETIDTSEELEKAIEEATGETMVTLGANITASIEIPTGKTITLDLNGFTLTNEAGQHTIVNHGNLTIVGTGTVDNISHGKCAILNEADGKANLLGGTYDRSAEAGSSPSNNGGNSYYYIYNIGTMEMENVSVPGKSAYSSTVRNDGTLTIEDGTEISGNLIAVKNDSGTLYVKGGTLTSENDQAIQNWNEAHITGGTLDGTVTTWAIKNDAGTTEISGDAVVTKDVRSITYDNSEAVPTVKVNGGTFYGSFYKQAYDSQNSGSHYTELEAGSEEASIIIKKGTFEEKPDGEFIEEGAAITIISESKPNQGSSDNDDGGDYFGNETWDEVKDQIAEAEEGDTIKVSATGLPYFPSSVARALKGLDITLEIRKNGITYEVNGLEIGDIDKIWYEFDELETELLTADADSEAPAAEDEDKSNPDTGR